MKTFKIITFGCRLNQAESREIGQKLAEKGLKPVKKDRKADIIIVNTCSVTQKADKEVRQLVRRIKKKTPDTYLIVVGCWVENAQNYSREEINTKVFNKIDLLIDNKNKLDLDKIIFEKKQSIQKTNPQNRCQYVFKDKYAESNKVLIRIQTGCTKFCTYCVIPYLRGKEVSRSINQIISEIKINQKKGIKQIILTGVEISNYSYNKLGNKQDLADLLEQIFEQTTINKISFGSININAFTNKFINICKKNPKKINRKFHIPLQSGCDSTLERMNRKYTTKKFYKTIEKIQKKLPDFKLSTDLIVGFPGETNQEFKQTLEYLKKLNKLLNDNFFKIHVFRYSPRKGTIAEKMEKKGLWKKVNGKTKKLRSHIVRKLL